MLHYPQCRLQQLLIEPHRPIIERMTCEAKHACHEGFGGPQIAGPPLSWALLSVTSPGIAWSIGRGTADSRRRRRDSCRPRQVSTGRRPFRRLGAQPVGRNVHDGSVQVGGDAGGAPQPYLQPTTSAACRKLWGRTGAALASCTASHTVPADALHIQLLLVLKCSAHPARRAAICQQQIRCSGWQPTAAGSLAATASHRPLLHISSRQLRLPW